MPERDRTCRDEDLDVRLDYLVSGCVTFEQVLNAVDDFFVRTWWFWSLPPVWGAVALVVVWRIIRPGRRK